MSFPAMRTCLPNTIVQSWRSSLSQQQAAPSTGPSMRTIFSSSKCLKHLQTSSQPFVPPFQAPHAAMVTRITTRPPHHTFFNNTSSGGSSASSSIPSFKSILTSSRLAQTHKKWNQQGSTRSFSLSAILKAARPNWYADRQVETVRAGPIKKLQWSIDRKVPKSWLFYGIIAANVIVFLGWQYAINSATRFRDFGPYVFMMKNFAASWANLVRPWTIITSCFSHMDTGHIFVNLFSFYFMGQAAMSILSTSQFAGLYLLAGLAGNAVQMLWHPVQGNTGQPSFALGASGAISGVLSFYAMAFPHHKLILFFVIPAPAWLAVSGIIAYDMYTAIARPNGGIAAAAHLGGAGAGILYFLKLVGRRPF